MLYACNESLFTRIWITELLSWIPPTRFSYWWRANENMVGSKPILISASTLDNVHNGLVYTHWFTIQMMSLNMTYKLIRHPSGFRSMICVLCFGLRFNLHRLRRWCLFAFIKPILINRALEHCLFIYLPFLVQTIILISIIHPLAANHVRLCGYQQLAPKTICFFIIFFCIQ